MKAEDEQMLESLEYYKKVSDGITVGIPFELANDLYDSLSAHPEPPTTTPLWDKERIAEAMQRSEMAASVTLPIEDFRDLLLQAEQAIRETP